VIEENKEVYVSQLFIEGEVIIVDLLPDILQATGPLERIEPGGISLSLRSPPVLKELVA